MTPPWLKTPGPWPSARMSLEDGLALREGTAWRLMPGNDPGRYAGLLSIADLDAFLRTDAARTPRVSMADGARKGGAGVPVDDYIEEGGDRVDLPRLLARHDDGASLVVSQFHEIHPPLARFCRGLEKAFLHGVQANIYLTPPGAQGFRVHFDTHDVLVLQVSGRKAWRVWDAIPYAAPTRHTPWHNNAAPEGEPACAADGAGRRAVPAARRAARGDGAGGRRPVAAHHHRLHGTGDRRDAARPAGRAGGRGARAARRHPDLAPGRTRWRGGAAVRPGRRAGGAGRAGAGGSHRGGGAGPPGARPDVAAAPRPGGACARAG